MTTSDKIKNVNITDVISRYINLIPKGSRYVALCPFHEEKTPSFTVTPSMKIFKCFGCGESGDVIDFIQKYNNIGFTEALKLLDVEINVKSTTNRPGPLQTSLVGYLPGDLLKKSMKRYHKNNFTIHLSRLFPKGLKKEIIKSYLIGSSDSYWPNATVFWYVDQNSNIREAKIMLYNPDTGKRIRSKQNHILRIGKQILQENGIAGKIEPCLFGAHLIPQSHRDIAIVESEKTAIWMEGFSRYFSHIDYTWLATGGKFGFQWTNQNVNKVLTGKNVVLFPDYGAFEDWRKNANILKSICNKVVISDLLENKGNELNLSPGDDIADYYYKLFQAAKAQKINSKTINPDSPPEEILKFMKSKNPVLDTLIKAFDLKLITE